MHPAARAFVEKMVAERGPWPAVLEFGSYNVNGTVRSIFTNWPVYVGVDIRPGPCVDVVGDIHDWSDGKQYPCVVCCETLEHIHNPERAVRHMRELLLPNGTLILTCASRGRPRHGCNGEYDDGGNGEVYQDWLTAQALADWLDGMWLVDVVWNHDANDLYAVARQPGLSPRFK